MNKQPTEFAPFAPQQQPPSIFAEDPPRTAAPEPAMEDVKPKRRSGRPKKADAPVTQTATVPAARVAPKRRRGGRPKKGMIAPKLEPIPIYKIISSLAGLAQQQALLVGAIADQLADPLVREAVKKLLAV